jgi:hypothetical protein
MKEEGGVVLGFIRVCRSCPLEDKFASSSNKEIDSLWRSRVCYSWIIDSGAAAAAECGSQDI